MATARSKLKTLHKLAARFNEASHPRYPKGHPMGGKFMKSDDEIPLQLPIERQMPGRKTTTLLELSAIAADDTGNLSEDELERLCTVRNGTNSYEEFLATPADKLFDPQEIPVPRILYAGKRVQMTLSNSGNVAFSVDSSYHVREQEEESPEEQEMLAEMGFEYKKPRKPSEELAGMESIFSRFLSSPSADQVLSNTPANESTERHNMRVKHYTKAGFMTVQRYGDRVDFMAMDNRSNQTDFAPVPGRENIFIRGKEIKKEEITGGEDDFGNPPRSSEGGVARALARRAAARARTGREPRPR